MSDINRQTIPITDAEERKEKVIKGIDIMLQLFELANQPLFPRKMTTDESNGTMFMVESKEQMLEACIKADYYDCRINAYPHVVDCDITSDVIPPTLLFFDLDRNLTNIFPNNEEFEKVASATRLKIRTTLGVDPTLILWTGGGIHFYTVIRTSPLHRLHAKILQFCSDLDTQSSKEFLRFTEQYFTNEKCDPRHGPSIKSCLIRIPYTLNSKYEVIGENNERRSEEVTVLMNNLDNKDVASITEDLVREFKYYLSDMKVKQILDKEEYAKRQRLYRLRKPGGINAFNPDIGRKQYSYIEKLIAATPTKNRYFAIWTLIGPYYRKVQGLSYEEAQKKLFGWLEKCDKVETVPNMKNKVYSALYKAHEFNPWSIKRIEEENLRSNGTYNNILKIIKG